MMTLDGTVCLSLFELRALLDLISLINHPYFLLQIHFFPEPPGLPRYLLTQILN